MARPLIEFIFAQNLPWASQEAVPHRPGLPAKILSRDTATEACAAILRLPAGYDAAIASDYDEELYVLAGSLTLNGQPLKRDGYAEMPVGCDIRWASDAGAEILLWLDDPDPAHALLNAPELRLSDALAMPWDRAFIPPGLEFMGLARKVLRTDPVTGAQRTFLLTTSPQNYPENWECKTETHPCVEECFMLAGELTGPYGVMTAGAYFWRPPQIVHGPFGSRDGSLSLIRFRDGPHVNIWSDEPLPYSFDVPYAPALPEEYGEALRRPYSGAERY